MQEDPATLRCPKCTIEEWVGKCDPSRTKEPMCEECKASGKHTTYRIVQCTDCKTKDTARIEGKSLRETAWKEKVMRDMAHANPVQSEREWTKANEKIARKLGLNRLNLENLGDKCEKCGNPVRKTARKPRLKLCEDCHQAYYAAKNRAYVKKFRGKVRGL